MKLYRPLILSLSNRTFTAFLSSYYHPLIEILPMFDGVFIVLYRHLIELLSPSYLAFIAL